MRVKVKFFISLRTSIDEPNCCQHCISFTPSSLNYSYIGSAGALDIPGVGNKRQLPMNEYILLRTEKSFVEVYAHLKTTLLDLDDKSLGESGHERFGLNIGGGQYYSFGKTNRLEINLIRNEGEVEFFGPQWTFYLWIWLDKRYFDVQDYNIIKANIEGSLNKIGQTRITAEID